ncbi:MAG TPA: choice-of-anchor tandem repeat GloVer-containing protein [Rhizomicrobium sp.]|nr:choice-of-anchor tandem repeat GloVer-containing protein [Rhizomicrobium sp.]
MTGTRYVLLAAAIVAIFARPSNGHSEDVCTPVTGDALEVCHAFVGGDTDGEFPQAGVTIGSDGLLYGTTYGGFAGDLGKRCSKNCGNAYRADPGGGDSQILAFNGESDGAYPASELFIEPSGTIYGTTEFGPGTGCGGLGCGSLFRITDGTEKVAHLCRLDGCADGIHPQAGLISDGQGSLYGTTTFGGKGNGWLCGSYYGGCGTAFLLIDKPLSASPIYSFCTRKNCADGAVPAGRLIRDTRAGQPLRFFGTTEFGGAYGAGTVFQLTLQNGTWKEKVLYSFCAAGGTDCTDGAVPETGLVMDGQDGTLYGTTAYGGFHAIQPPPNNCPNDENGLGCGVVFRLDQPYRVADYRVLHAFTGGNDGQRPESQLALDATNALYGATFQGGGSNCGASHGCGTLFALPAAGGAVSILHAFDAGDPKNPADGAHPNGALTLLDVAGSRYVYGVARNKGHSTECCGTLYRYKIQ